MPNDVGAGEFVIQALYKGEVYSERRVSRAELDVLMRVTMPIQAGALVSAVLMGARASATVLGDSADSKFRIQRIKP